MQSYSKLQRESRALIGARAAGESSAPAASELRPPAAEKHTNTRQEWLRSVRGEALRVGGIRRSGIPE